jgi:hypothetical protein
MAKEERRVMPETPQPNVSKSAMDDLTSGSPGGSSTAEVKGGKPGTASNSGGGGTGGSLRAKGNFATRHGASSAATAQVRHGKPGA